MPYTRAIIIGLIAIVTRALGDEPTQASLDGESFSLKRWTTEHGLPQNSVTALLQSGNGYLWVGTFGGLVRFDGQRFVVYDIANTEGLESNRVTALCESPEGVIWVGTSGGGITRLDTRTGVSVAFYEGVPGGVVWGVAATPGGAVWAIGRELSRFSGGRWAAIRTPFSEESGLTYRALFIDTDGSVWAGGASGIVHVAGDTVEALTAFEGLGETERVVLRIGRLDSGELWVAGRYFAVLRGGRFERITSEISWKQSSSTVLSSTIGDHGGTWLGVGRRMYVTRGFQSGSLAVDEMQFVGENLAETRSMLRDREGNIWLGTNGQGLVRLRRAPFHRYRGDTERTPESGPTGLTTDPATGGMWISYPRFVVLMGANGRTSPNSRLGSVHATTDRRGRVWVVNDRNLVRLAGGDEQRFPMGDVDVSELLVDAANRLWVSFVDGSLSVLRDGALVRLREADGDPTTYRTVLEARDGAFWIGSPHALMRWNGQDTTHRYTVDDGLPKGGVRGMYEDEAGALWVGTYGGGLARLEGGRFTVVTTDDGLVDNSIGGILEDDRGRLWVNSNRGVFGVALEELRAFCDGDRTSVSCRALQTGEGNGAAAAKSPDGRLWFPTLTDVVAVEPPANDAGTRRQNAIVESVVADRIELRGAGKKVVVPGRRELEFRFTSPVFAVPEAVRFRYRLRGFDADWVEAGTRRTANYANLAPGHYRFEVMARASDGAWSRESAAVELELLPYFYETGWFLSACVAAGALLIVAVYRLRTASIRRSNELLRESESRFRTLVEYAPEAVLVLDDDEGRFVDVNENAIRQLGLSREELLRMGPRDIASEESLPRESDSRYRAAALRGETPTFAFTYTRPDGREIPFEVRLVRIPAAGRRLIRGSLVDISSRVEAERRNRELQTQLHQSARLEAIGRLAGGVAHDFNNLLTVLMSHSYTLGQRVGHEISEEVRNEIEEIDACTRRAATLTRQLLAFGRRQVLKPTTLDPAEVNVDWSA